MPFTVSERLPPRANAGGYDTALDAAHQNHGQWIRLDQHGGTDRRKVEVRRSALCNHIRANRPQREYRTAVRKDGDLYYPYVQAIRQEGES